MSSDQPPSDGPVNLDTIGACEADQFNRMSAWAGHAGPSSSYPYINQFEAPLLALTRSARLSAWARPPSQQALTFFCELANDPAAPRRQTSDFDGRPVLFASPRDVGLRVRLNLTSHVADFKLDAVAAAASYLDEKVAQTILLEVHEAMELARLIRRKELTPRAAVAGVRAYGTWVVAAKATKLREVLQALGARMESGDVSFLRSLFDCWRQVRLGEHLSMDDGYTAAAFLRHLQNLGLDRKTMLVKSREGAPDLDRSVAAFRLPIVSLGCREERVQHRLQLIEPDVDPEHASGKQVSSVGFHWLMVLVTSWLRGTGELTWS